MVGKGYNGFVPLKFDLEKMGFYPFSTIQNSVIQQLPTKKTVPEHLTNLLSDSYNRYNKIKTFIFDTLLFGSEHEGKNYVVSGFSNLTRRILKSKKTLVPKN
jgi:hypothetical protein